jgi:hypothetical protein
MEIAITLIITGIFTNIVTLAQPRKTFPRFAKACVGCNCQTPPMEYPPAVYGCPVCQWVEQMTSQKSSNIS